MADANPRLEFRVGEVAGSLLIRDALEFGSAFLCTTLNLAGAPYVMPAAYRAIMNRIGELEEIERGEKERKKISLSATEDAGIVLGAVAGLAVLAFEGWAYWRAVSNGHPGYLAIPAATNALALWGQSTVDRAKTILSEGDYDKSS